MNIIRTKVVEINEIPAIAYKLKLKSGGSGIKMHRTDKDATAFAEVDKRAGSCILDKIDQELFPETAFDEALELLEGLPYSARGKVKILVSDEVEAEDVCSGDSSGDLPTTAQMIESDEFNAIIDRYSDENGKINYALMNKQFMQFAQTSRVVGDMIGKRDSENDIRLFVLKNRAAFLANKKEHLSDEEATALMEALNEISPRSAFKELNLYLRKRLSR